MKFFIKTYGCQMNVRDSESVSSLLLDAGYEQAGSEGEADIFIVNTCSVRGKAEDKAIGKLGIMAKNKKRDGVSIIGVMGCMAQRLGPDLFKRVRDLDFALGTHRFSKVCEVIEEIRSGYGPVLEIEEDGDEGVEDLSGHTVKGPSAFVNILFGCNRRCTYCIVPSVRGNERSRSGESIVDEVRKLVDSGVSEVTLLGQSVMSYGRLGGSVWQEAEAVYGEPLARLLQEVAGIEGIKRVRFTSGHPSGCTEELVKAMAEIPEVCEHMHLPMQSGSDRILKMMRRGYDSDGYREAVGRLRKAMPQVAITTDIIVGFPSETEEDFEKTRAMMTEIGFDNSFIFKYSPRPGTPAADMEDDVSDEEKLRRNKLLLDDQDSRAVAINEKLVGSTVEVLAEGVSLRNTERWSGRTRTNKITVFPPVQDIKVGEIVYVAVERAMAQTVYGEIVQGS